MAVTAPHRKITADEFFALTAEQPRAQLIDGVIVVSEPQMRHERIILWLVHLFMSHREGHPGCGELAGHIDTPLDEHNVYVPDLWWVPEERMLPGNVHIFPQPPPLVVEVRSPSTWRFDTGTKLRHYESAGVAEAWLIDTVAEVVRVYRRAQPDAERFEPPVELRTGDVLSTPLVPGWQVDLTGVFAR
jgi:Uma2 family endonuclease